MEILIGEKQSGKIILNVLKGDLGLSGRIITFLKQKEDGILLNGNHATVRNKLCAGDVLTVNYKESSPTKASSILPVPLPIDILYEDEDVLVLNKPARMPTHPSHDHQTDTLANGLMYLCQQRGTPFVFRAINRLDADTSGVVLIAKNKLAAFRLSQQMSEKKIKKEYLAILHGTLPVPEGSIEKHIILDDGSMIKRRACDNEEGASYALTLYQTLSSNALFSAVIASPVTGRTHQLRVHFSSVGCPICGDTLYGYPSELISRQALHSYKISFFHPTTGEELNVTAPIPEDMESLARSIFEHTPYSFKENKI